MTEDSGLSYVSLTSAKKGIDVNTLHVYRSWSASTGTCSNEITGFRPVYDTKYGNLVKLENIQTNDDTKTVYMTYKYKPQLYYENIIKTWQIKLATDLENKENYNTELIEIEQNIADLEEEIDNLLHNKDELITSFEHMMGPALREGYWNPENYNDYGDVKTATLQFPNTGIPNPFIRFTDDDVVAGWDDLLFDNEDKIYYNVGVNETKVYYPCINLSSIIASNPNNIREHINEYSFIFNNNYEDHTADLTNIRYIRSFSVGSEALLRFVKNRAGVIFPVLVLVGAKNMSDGSNGSFNEIAFMKRKTKTENGITIYGGNPRLGIINSTIESTVVSTVIDPFIEVDDDSFWTFGSNTINQCTQVYPRINFNNISVKADTSNLYISYNNVLLDPYIDYQITTRTTHYTVNGHLMDRPEYYITLKSDVFWNYPKPVSDTDEDIGKVKINYIVSNLATSIYIDALEVSKKNSEPKVEYNLEAN